MARFLRKSWERTLKPVILAGVSRVERARGVVPALGMLVALALLVGAVHHYAPVRTWPIQSYAQAALVGLGFSVACTSGGYAALRWLGLRGIGLSERLLLAMTLGVLEFFWGMFVGGILQLYGPVFALVWPLLLAATGAVPLGRDLGRAWPHLRTAWARPRSPKPLASLASLLGLFGLFLVYANILTPENAAYDARWYHLPLAEHYVAAGGITRSPEGWYQSTLPHLSSVLYAWPHMLSWLGHFDQLMIAAHLEFVLFVWTLAGVPVLVRWLVPGTTGRATWAAYFLFTGVLVYDSTLSLAADHIAAFWAIPIYLALRRAYRRLEVGPCVLLGALLSGAMLTKYQSVALLTFPALALTLRAGRCSWRALGSRIVGAPNQDVARPRWVLGPLALLGSLLVLTAPHWLKNWIWHGDPLYPALHGLLNVRPWHADAAYNYATLVEPHLWRPHGNLPSQVAQTLRATFAFSFRTPNWPEQHGTWPVFGFLFTLSWLFLPFLRPKLRVLGLFGAGHVAVVTWFLSSHIERYLQIVLPWMVGVVAAALVLAWRSGFWSRALLLCLLGAQVAWGTVVYAIPAHFFTRWSAPKSLELMSSTYTRDTKLRQQVFGDYSEVGQSLPPDARVLLHRFEVHAGLRRQVIMDHPVWQGLFNYGRLRSMQDVYALMKRVGVTHVMWTGDNTRGEASLAFDLRFLGFASWVLGEPAIHGAIRVAPLPETLPAERFGEWVFYLGCSGYKPGIYALSDLTVPGPTPPSAPGFPEPGEALSAGSAGIARLAAKANYVVMDPTCPGPVLPAFMLKPFERLADRGSEQLLVRRTPRPR